MKTGSQPLQLILLGAPRLEHFSADVQLPRKKELALLAYMAFGKQAYNRDILATLLWPNQDDSHARGNLRRLLYELRGIVGEELLPVEGERVGPLELGPRRTRAYGWTSRSSRGCWPEADSCGAATPIPHKR